MKNSNKETKLHRRRLSLILGIIILNVIAIINIFSFYTLDTDQFNLFHKYKNFHRLETWNIPNNVDVDINGDGVEDRVTWTGCLILSGTQDKEIVSKQYGCHDDQTKGISVFKIGKSLLPQIRLSYVGKTNTNKWDIVLIKNLHTDLFNIGEKGEVIQKKPPFSLRVDTAMYFISHLFVFITGM